MVMIIWLMLWLAAVVLEGLAYLTITRRAAADSTARRFVFSLVAIVVTAAAVLALKSDWRLWLLPSLFVPYQLINIARAVCYRLQPDRLRNVSLHTLAWLVVAQIVTFVLSWFVVRRGMDFLPMIITSLQACTAVVLFSAATHAWEHTKPAAAAKPMTDRELPSLSVLVPARNETYDLQVCLEHLVASDYPKLEIIALDDNSANRRTPEIIRSFAHDGVRFVQGKEPSENWLAKNHAYNRLLDEASGELVVFCGVDVLVEPQTLRRLVEVLIAEKRDMLSILPLRPEQEHRRLSFIQAMRYWWELGWPRRAFNRPPVLSTLWLMRAEALRRAGGFRAAARMIVPEAYFARQAVKSDAYMFVRSTPAMPVYSTKSIPEQYNTAIRVRYPQLHHRLALVSFVALFELLFLLGPFLFLPAAIIWGLGVVPALLSGIAVLLLSYIYYLVAIRTHLNNFWLGLISSPVAFLLDIFMLHDSMFKYEFGTVIWHDRSISEPMLEVVSPKAFAAAESTPS